MLSLCAYNDLYENNIKNDSAGLLNYKKSSPLEEDCSEGNVGLEVE